MATREELVAQAKQKWQRDQLVEQAKQKWKAENSQKEKPASSEGDIGEAAQAGLEHFGNAAALGYMPQIQGFVSKVMPDPNADLDKKLKEQGFTVSPQEKTYAQERDAYAKRLQDQESNHPVASAVGTIGGSLASGIAASGLTPINAATRLGRVAQAAKGGAIIGALSNPGDTEGEVNILQGEDRLRNLAVGGTIGAAGQGLIEGASAAAKGVGNLAGKLNSKAEERAFKSSGAMLKDYRNAASKDKINDLGRFMLDNGMVEPGSSFETVAAKSGAIKQEAGAKIAETYKAANDAVNNPKFLEKITPEIKQSLEKSAFNPVQFADEFESALQSEYKGTAGFRKALPQVQSVLSDIKEIGPDANILQLQKAKVDVDSLINYDKEFRDQPLAKQLLAKLRGKLSEKIDSRISALDNALGSDALAGLKEANKKYGMAAQLEGISSDRVLRENANRFFSPSDYMTSVGGAVVGAATGDGIENKIKNAAIGAGLGLANKGMRKYGTPLVSKALDKAGSFLRDAGLESLGRTAAPALEATERTPSALANTIGVMSKTDLSEPIQKVAAEDITDRNPAQTKKKSNLDRWANEGAKRLGVDKATAAVLMNSEKGRTLLREASDLKPGSKRFQEIKNEISQGRWK